MKYNGMGNENKAFMNGEGKKAQGKERNVEKKKN